MITTSNYTDEQRLYLRSHYIHNEADTDQYGESQPAAGLALIASLAGEQRILPELLEAAAGWMHALAVGEGARYAGAEQYFPLLELNFDVLWARGEHPYYDTDGDVREALEAFELEDAREADGPADAQPAPADPGQVWIVITFEQGRIVDLEVLDACPRWDWPAAGQIVRTGNVNGGDSILVPYRPAAAE